jgi:hypothetical protein
MANWSIWYILWSFGLFYGNLVYFPRFGILHLEKSGNPALDRQTIGLLKRMVEVVGRARIFWVSGLSIQAWSFGGFSN